MIEIPESINLAKQLEQTVRGKTVKAAIANLSPHKFAFYYGEPTSYSKQLTEQTVDNTTSFAGQVEISLGNLRLLFNDGINIRYITDKSKLPKKHQLCLEFTDNSYLVFTVQMYGCLFLFPEGENENPYYLVAKEKPSPLTNDFSKDYFTKLYEDTKKTVSVKAFLATEQRIPGLGNGVLQDILFLTKINPKTKINTLTDSQIESLFHNVKQTLQKMTDLNGRDTEKDLFGNFGDYQTILSKNTITNPCPVCHSTIIK